MLPVNRDEMNRFAALDMVGEARRYLQREFETGASERHHLGDIACTVAHWKRVLRRIPEWTRAPNLPA